MSNWEENEYLRCDFIETTKLNLWSEDGDNDARFSEEYVFWLEELIIESRKNKRISSKLI